MLLLLIEYDLGDPETVSTAVGYLLQVAIACRIVFCFIKVSSGLCRTCYITSVTATWSRTFGIVDVNQDKRIDRQEWIAHFGNDRRFDLYDIGHDGSVSNAEFLAHEKALRGNAHELDAESQLMVEWSDKFGTADVNRDGRIDRQEWIAHFGDDLGFELYDIGQDGSVSRIEFQAYEEFSALDVNNDDKLSRDEWIAHFGDDTEFDTHDLSDDGTLSRAGFLATLTTIQRIKHFTY